MALVVTSGCAGEITKEGLGNVSQLTQEATGQSVTWVRNADQAKSVKAEKLRLLSKPLSSDSTVRIALLNNREIQAALSDVGIAAADLAQAQRPANPGFSYGRLKRGDEIEIERSFGLNLISILTVPIRTDIEKRRFERTKLATAQRIIALIAEARAAYFSAVGAAEITDYTTKIGESIRARADLARRMRQTGNFSKLNFLRDQVLHAETAAQLRHARNKEFVARERLARLLGLWGTDLKFKLPRRLPNLPNTLAERTNLENKAMSDRLDIRMARAEISSLAKSLGLTQATRFVNVLELSYLDNSETGLPDQTGYEIHLEIPLFDWGDAKEAKAESLYLKAVNQLAARAVEARSQVRLAHAGYQANYNLARHYRDEIVPLRQQISEEMVYLYNGMLISIFDLLADTRDQIAAVVRAIEAKREFWLAENNLRFVTIGDVGGSGAASPTQPAEAPVPSGGH
jgi:outer membrane protein TolC